MDLVGLWEHVPPLLSACVIDGNNVLRHLRLVNKEASRVALLAMKSFTLTLTEPRASNSASWVRSLHHTQLESLDVRVILEDSFRPSLMLKTFVQNAGKCLDSTTRLGLHLQNLGSCAASQADLDESLGLLVSACPALRSLSLYGQLSSNILKQLGEACPLLSALTIIGAGFSDDDYLQFTLLQLQPTLLPQINSLAFKDCMQDFELPDLCTNEGIRSIDIPGWNFDSDYWSFLPAQLLHLCCGTIEEAPPEFDEDQKFFPDLLSIKACGSSVMSCHDISQILCAAPSLQHLSIGGIEIFNVQIDCRFTESLATSLSSDFEVLLQGMRVHPCLAEAKLHLDCRQRAVDGEASLLAGIASLPCMTGVTSIEILGLDHGELGPMLTRFPDVSDLSLVLVRMDDVGLQEVAACLKLTTLTIMACSEVSPMGLLSVCQLCPGLCTVKCSNCPDLRGKKLVDCEKLLQRHGLTASVVDITDFK